MNFDRAVTKLGGGGVIMYLCSTTDQYVGTMSKVMSTYVERGRRP